MTKALKENAVVFTAYEDWSGGINFTMTNLYGQTQSCVFQTTVNYIHPHLSPSPHMADFICHCADISSVMGFLSFQSGLLFLVYVSLGCIW